MFDIQSISEIADGIWYLWLSKLKNNVKTKFAVKMNVNYFLGFHDVCTCGVGHIKIEMYIIHECICILDFLILMCKKKLRSWTGSQSGKTREPSVRPLGNKQLLIFRERNMHCCRSKAFT